jgi:prevent-host-death family protein
MYNCGASISTVLVMDVAMSELRANLKSWVERARDGERVVVTDRGVPVARLVPVDAEGLFDRLEREGTLVRAKTRRPVARRRRRVVAAGAVADDVVVNRRSRDDRVLR